MLQNLKQSLLVSLLVCLSDLSVDGCACQYGLTRLSPWRLMNMVWVAIGSFFLSYLWRFMLERQKNRRKVAEEGGDTRSRLQILLEDMSFRYKAMGVILFLSLLFPLLFDTYQTNIMISALIYVVLGLGLNISVGLAGLLDLGYVAFFGVGAYTFALLNHHFGIGFWPTLPIGGIIGCLFGVILGFPILRLRGDYLAIVTLGFGMIFKVVMENWDGLSFGPSGIANIDKPGLFGLDMNLATSTIYIYYIMIALVVFTILITNRLKNSRIGRAWIALREDEIACVVHGDRYGQNKAVSLRSWGFLGWHGRCPVCFKDNLYQSGELYLHGIGNHSFNCCSWRHGVDSRCYSRCFYPDSFAGIHACFFRISHACVWSRNGPYDDFSATGDYQRTATEIRIYGQEGSNQQWLIKNINCWRSKG